MNDQHTLNLRAGPTVGTIYVGGSTDVEFSGASYRIQSGNNFTFGGGVCIGLSWELEKDWFLELSDRFTVSTSISVEDYAGVKTGAIIGNQATISVGTKF